MITSSSISGHMSSTKSSIIFFTQTHMCLFFNFFLVIGGPLANKRLITFSICTFAHPSILSLMLVRTFFASDPMLENESLTVDYIYIFNQLRHFTNILLIIPFSFSCISFSASLNPLSSKPYML